MFIRALRSSERTGLLGISIGRSSYFEVPTLVVAWIILVFCVHRDEVDILDESGERPDEAAYNQKPKLLLPIFYRFFHLLHLRVEFLHFQVLLYLSRELLHLQDEKALHEEAHSSHNIEEFS